MRILKGLEEVKEAKEVKDVKENARAAEWREWRGEWSAWWLSIKVRYYHMITIPVKEKLGDSAVKFRKNVCFRNWI